MAATDIQSLRKEYARLRRNALYIMSKEEFEAQIEKANPQTPEEYVAAAKKVRVKCRRCRNGIYYWGACVNGKMTHSGACFRCEGKGYQDQEDAVRNWAYDQHIKVF